MDNMYKCTVIKGKQSMTVRRCNIQAEINVFLRSLGYNTKSISEKYSCLELNAEEDAFVVCKDMATNIVGLAELTVHYQLAPKLCRSYQIENILVHKDLSYTEAHFVKALLKKFVLQSGRHSNIDKVRIPQTNPTMMQTDQHLGFSPGPILLQLLPRIPKSQPKL